MAIIVFTEQTTEQRWSERKVLKVRALLSMNGSEPITARTHDVGGNGMSLTLSHPLSVGKMGVVRFDLLQDGKAKRVVANIKVAYCIYSSGEFKIGLQFQHLDLMAMTALSKFVS